MGITGLLPIVKHTLQKKHISEFKNKKIGIDAFPWLYQILNSIPEELFYNISTTKHTIMFEKRIKSLLSHSIIPVVVFDGDFLSSKEKTNAERSLRKEKYRKEVEACISRGNHMKAKELMKRCIGVSKEIVYDCCNVLKKLNIEYFISPYEADAQLYFLEREGYIDCIMTEDSDLIPFGCQNILFKFDGFFVDYFTRGCLEKAKDAVFKDYIQDICILSGCDYADSIPGIGIQTAHRLVLKFKTIKDIVSHISLKKKIPKGYIEEYVKAKLTFKHQIVWDPKKGERVYLNPPDLVLDFLGSLEHNDYIIERPVPVIGKTQIIQIQRHYKPIETTK